MEATFKIPELRSQIAQNLTKSDLKICMLVCQGWAQDFRPYLWHKVVLNQQLAYTMTKDLFQKYAYLIRTLVISDPMPLLNDWFLPRVCSNLVEISIEPRLSPKRRLVSAMYRSSRHTDQSIDFMSLASVDKIFDLIIDCSPTLQKVEEQWFTLSQAHTNLFAEWLCRQRTGLSEISTCHWKLSSFDQLYSLLEMNSRLRTLSLLHISIDLTNSNDNNNNSADGGNGKGGGGGGDGGGNSEMTLDFGKLWNLSLSAVKLKEPEGSVPLKIQVQARELVSLTFTGLQDTFPSPSNPLSLARKISSWYCPNLKELNLTHDDNDANHSVMMLFASANRLETLSITDSIIHPTEAIQLLLQRHANTLKSIDLSGTIGLASSDLQSILTSCPNLIDFTGSGDKLWYTRLIQQPWVCRQLQSLVIFIHLPLKVTLQNGNHDSEAGGSIHTRNNEMKYTKEQLEMYKGVYDQLAPLTQLKSIRLGGFCRGGKHFIGIPWNLAAGLDRLRGLSKIESIYFTGNLSEIGTEEAWWFKKHWPRLKTIQRINSYIEVLDTQISDILGPGVRVY
ncbi:hypothetical protein BGZ80_004618 [Entomortierella chlamydospora]|uniref:F-box domain-containing protein n=1 Tax=Entomortierella chlamydospora TaxID=101097 RepID=A0A9P6SW85_9FUNG|nr:hypothetical protein BGZ80_004618 [Entomortierella chlamydospora]